MTGGTRQGEIIIFLHSEEAARCRALAGCRCQDLRRRPWCPIKQQPSP
jgi:hypothetical protein